MKTTNPMDCGGHDTAFTAGQFTHNLHLLRAGVPTLYAFIPRWSAVLLLFAILLLPLTASAATAATTVTVPLQNPDYAALFTELDSSLNNGNAYSYTDNTTGALGWAQSYYMLAYMQMYRATSNTLWLDKIATQFDRVLNMRDDRVGKVDVYAGRALKGWGGTNYDKEGRWHVYAVHTGMISQAPADFVFTVKRDPALNAKYGTAADRFLTELEEIVADANENFVTSGTMGYYTDPAWGDKRPAPLNMSNAMGSVIVQLYRITNKAEYKEQATKLANFFRASLRPGNHGRAWNWAYWPKNPGDPIERGEDISHAAINVDFAARCYHAGIVFSQKDMEQFAGTWMTKVRLLTSPSRQPQYADYVDGTLNPDVNYIPQAAGRWLPVITCVTPHMWPLYLDSITPAFAGQKIDMASQGLGLAYLARFAQPND